MFKVLPIVFQLLLGVYKRFQPIPHHCHISFFLKQSLLLLWATVFHEPMLPSGAATSDNDGTMGPNGCGNGSHSNCADIRKDSHVKIGDGDLPEKKGTEVVKVKVDNGQSFSNPIVTSTVDSSHPVDTTPTGSPDTTTQGCCSRTEWYFRHPWTRLFMAFIIMFCNFLLVAEDPIAHSQKEASIPVVGNCISLVILRWEGFWIALKIGLIVIGLVLGVFLGKVVLHNLILRDWLKLEMFGHPGRDAAEAYETEQSRQKAERLRANRGSFFCVVVMTLLVMYGFASVYNLFLKLGGDDIHKRLAAIDKFGVTDESFLRITTVGTFIADWATLFMVLDMMLQESAMHAARLSSQAPYPNWPPCASVLCPFWQRRRVLLFWGATLSALLVTILSVKLRWINWDSVRAWCPVPNNEGTRCFLASIIGSLDLIIVMQDPDFPTFTNNMDIKVVGFDISNINFVMPWCASTGISSKDSWFRKLLLHPPAVLIDGKWFNYSIIFVTMILDANMIKGQFIYQPEKYGQTIVADRYIQTTEPDGSGQVLTAQYLGLPPWIKTLFISPAILCPLWMLFLIYHQRRYDAARLRHRRRWRRLGSAVMMDVHRRRTMSRALLDGSTTSSADKMKVVLHCLSSNTRATPTPGAGVTTLGSACDAALGRTDPEGQGPPLDGGEERWTVSVHDPEDKAISDGATRSQPQAPAGTAVEPPADDPQGTVTEVGHTDTSAQPMKSSSQGS